MFYLGFSLTISKAIFLLYGIHHNSELNLSGTLKDLLKQLISFPTNFYVVSLTILCMDICKQFCSFITKHKNKTLMHVSCNEMFRIAQSRDQYFSLLLSFQLLYQRRIPLCSFVSHTKITQTLQSISLYHKKAI